MEWMTRLLGPLAKLVVWFFVAVVIPVTTWILVLRFDANANAQDIADVQADIAILKRKIDTKDLMLADKLEQIQRSLGRIEGRLGDP
jgi:hypothetical protein